MGIVFQVICICATFTVNRYMREPFSWTVRQISAELKLRERLTGLQKLAKINALSLCWVPGHRGRDSKDIAAKLARAVSPISVSGQLSLSCSKMR